MAGGGSCSLAKALLSRDLQAELQRQAVLLKGLLRDVAVMRDTVWHLSDELAGVSAPQSELEQLSADVRELQRAFGSFGSLSRQDLEEERANCAKLASYQESRSLEETRFEEVQSFRELETRFEEHSRMLESRFEENFLNPSFRHLRHLETRFEEHRSLLDARLEEMQSLQSLQSLRRLEARFEEHGQLLEARLVDHWTAMETRFKERSSSQSHARQERNKESRMDSHACRLRTERVCLPRRLAQLWNCRRS